MTYFIAMRHIIALHCLALSTLPTTVLAADRTWDADAGTTDWFTPQNWSGDSLPGPGDNAYINLASGVVVEGSANSATLDSLFIGVGGTGELHVRNGGTLISNNGWNIIGTWGDGTITVDGPGSNLTTGGMNIGGEQGTGLLEITNAGRVTSTDWVNIGENNGVGNVTVAGPGSRWDSIAGMNIGLDNEGHLHASDGAAVSVDSWVNIGNNWGSSGSVTLTDDDTQMHAGGMIVGNTGNGSLTVQDGASVISSRGVFAGNGGGSGTIIVSGSGSSISTPTNQFYIINGTASITNGGTVSSAEGDIANFVGSTGAVTISGNGSRWTNDSVLAVGNAGNGSLLMQDGGVITAHALQLAKQVNSTGTLAIGAAAGNAAAAAGYVNAPQIIFGEGAGKLVFNHTNTDYEFASALIGNGTVEFLSGTTLLTGDFSAFTGQFLGTAGLRFAPGAVTEITTDQSAFAGTTTVSGNTLVVSHTLGGTTIVGDGGLVKGNGTLHTLTVNQGGRVAPGNSIGITHVTNASFAPGSVYEVELNSAGQSDQILATGTTTLTGGTVMAIPYPDYRLDSPYTILTATGGVTGAFDDSVSSTPFLSALLSYDARNVYLTLTPNRAAADMAARSPNQRSVAAVTSAHANTLGFANALYTSADAAGFRAGLDALSGEVHASTAGALISEQQKLRSFVLSDSHSHDAFVTSGDTTFWMQGFGALGNVSGDANTARMTHHNAGALIGAERRGEDRRSGLAVGASRSHMRQDGRQSKAVSDNLHLIAYTGNQGGIGTTQHTVGASVSLHSIDTSRTVAVNRFNDSSTANYNGRSAELFAELAHPLAAGGKATLTPYLQGALTVQQQDGFTESGIAGLTSRSSTTKLGSSTLGVRYEHPFLTQQAGTLHASVGAAWQHLYGNNTPNAVMGFTAAPMDRFSVEGAPVARDAALLSASLTTQAREDIAFSLGYDASLATDATAHVISARGQYNF